MIGAPTFYPAGPIAIRDETAALVATVPGITAVFNARTMPGQDSQLPYAIVWNGGERTEPWGEPNVGAPRFMHTMTLIVDVLVSGDDDASLDADLVQFVETIRATLLTNPGWTSLFEGIERCDARYSYPKEAEDIMGQGSIEFEITFRSEWEPFIPDTFQEASVTVGVVPETYFAQTIDIETAP